MMIETIIESTIKSDITGEEIVLATKYDALNSIVRCFAKSENRQYKEAVIYDVFVRGDLEEAFKKHRNLVKKYTAYLDKEEYNVYSEMVQRFDEEPT